MGREKMKAKGLLKYIINRIFILFLIIFIILLLQLIIYIKTEEVWEDGLKGVLLYVGLVIAYGVILWKWIICPYQKSEKLQQYFERGHHISQERMEEGIFLAPSSKRNIEIVNLILTSPQAMEGNSRQAQYLALQNQINPHFLYNTLESIRGEALIEGLSSVAEMTEALAKFFRYTITKVENLVTVEEELENCETYFQIQKYRFGDRLNLQINYREEEREEIMGCKIPKLTLQPIVENSIIHGTELKIDSGNIEINLERTQKRLIIHILDDGAGIDEDTLLKLNKKIRGGFSQPSGEVKGGIALTNVNNRIQLIYGEEYGIYVYSMPGWGTDVEVNVPLE